MPAHVPFNERPLCSREEAKRALGDIGDTTFYNLVNSGKLVIRKIGDKTTVTTESVLRLAREGAARAHPKTPPVRRGPRKQRPFGDGEPPEAA
jgi:hypothetical protein